MLRVAILLAVVVLLFLFYKKFKHDKNLNKEILAVLIVLISLISFYEYQSSKEREKVTSLLIDFREGKTLICHDNKVSKKDFYYESGTMVFISKKIVDIKYPITSCKVKK